MVSTSPRDGSSTIPPSSDRGNIDAVSITGSCHTTIPPPPLLKPLSLLGADKRRKIPQLHFFLDFNLLAHYVKEMETPLRDFLLFPSYTI
jgi:hypothetical protein